MFSTVFGLRPSLASLAFNRCTEAVSISSKARVPNAGSRWCSRIDCLPATPLALCRFLYAAVCSDDF